MAAKTEALVKQYVSLSLAKLGLDYAGDDEFMAIIKKKSALELSGNIAKLRRLEDFTEDEQAAEAVTLVEEERRNGSGNGASNWTKKGDDITEPQKALIIKLTIEKHGVDLEAEGNESLLEIVTKLKKKQATEAIDRLLKLPRHAGPALAKAEDGGLKPVETEDDPEVLPGRYVVDGLMVKVTQGKKGTQWFGKRFVREIESDRLLRGEERLNVLKAIMADPAKCALEYTALTGCCSNCNRTLTNSISIEEAMGPICSGRFGRAYGFTILGEVYVDKPKRARKVKPEAHAEAVQEAEVPQKVAGEPTRSIASGSAAKKAQKVLDALAAIGASGSLVVEGDTTTLTAMVDGKVLQVTWDGPSFRYGADSTLGGKRYRNVSELIRTIA